MKTALHPPPPLLPPPHRQKSLLWDQKETPDKSTTHPAGNTVQVLGISLMNREEDSAAAEEEVGGALVGTAVEEECTRRGETGMETQLTDGLLDASLQLPPAKDF